MARACWLDHTLGSGTGVIGALYTLKITSFERAVPWLGQVCKPVCTCMSCLGLQKLPVLPGPRRNGEHRPSPGRTQASCLGHPTPVQWHQGCGSRFTGPQVTAGREESSFWTGETLDGYERVWMGLQPSAVTALNFPSAVLLNKILT